MLKLLFLENVKSTKTSKSHSKTKDTTDNATVADKDAALALNDNKTKNPNKKQRLHGSKNCFISGSKWSQRGG
jgi:hypothetical protein